MKLMPTYISSLPHNIQIIYNYRLYPDPLYPNVGIIYYTVIKKLDFYPLNLSILMLLMHREIIKQAKRKGIHTARNFAQHGSKFGTSIFFIAPVNHSQASMFLIIFASSNEPPVRAASNYHQLKGINNWKIIIKKIQSKQHHKRKVYDIK